jgi:hypothetical protein
LATKQELVTHKEVYDRAQAVYQERDAVREGLWKDYSARDQLVAAKIKIDRCISLLDKRHPDADEHILSETPDIINYTIFAERKINGE